MPKNKENAFFSYFPEIHSRESSVSKYYLPPVDIYQLTEVMRMSFGKSCFKENQRYPTKTWQPLCQQMQSCRNYVMSSTKMRTEWCEQQITETDGLVGTTETKFESV